MEQRDIKEENCTLKRHLVVTSGEMSKTARFAATLLATMDYFHDPKGPLHSPSAEELATLTQLYQEASIDHVAIRSRCVHCSLQTPCLVARALEVCDSLCGKLSAGN